MNEKICRLCLQTIGGNYQEIGEALKNILGLNLDISRETVTCIECTNNLEILFELKSVCVDMSMRVLSLGDLKNDVSLDSVKIENTNNLKPVIKLKDELRCSFCMKSTGGSLISLHESKEHIFLMDILVKYIPELNLSNIGEVLTCRTFLDKMQSVASFLMKCSDVEEKINKYFEIDGANDKGQIELKNVQQFIFKPMLFETKFCHINELRNEFPVKAEGKMTHVTEDSKLELLIKTDDVDIKSEQSDWDSSQEGSAEIELNTIIKSSSGKKMFKCETCGFETKSKQYLNQHKLKHKDPLEITMFKCEMCEYVTKRNFCLKTHMLVHKSSSEVTMFKCDSCTYETKYRHQLNEHKLIHRNPSEITMLKCGLCTFQAKRKRNLSNHMMFLHKNLSESTLYKCELCTYETRYKPYLNRHKLVHKSPSEVNMYKCDTCSYETKRRNVFNAHKLIHKGPSEATMFGCEMCTFKTKHKRNLKGHVLTHINSSEVTKFRCKMCAFETIYKPSLKRHMSIHKSPSEVMKYECETCSYKTNHKYRLVKHKLAHRSPSDVTV